MTKPSNQQAQKTSESGIHRRKRRKKISDAIFVAFIGATATIVVGFLGFPPFSQWVGSKLFPTPTNTALPQSPTITNTIIPSSTSTETPLPPTAVLPTETFTPSPEPTFTSIPTMTLVQPKMVVMTWANKYAGEVPLAVKFTAENSYVEFADGTRSYCSPSTCAFTWSVVNVTSNIFVATPQPWRESFAFTFPKKGLYYVKVTVCQNEICADGQVQVEGR